MFAELLRKKESSAVSKKTEMLREEFKALSCPSIYILIIYRHIMSSLRHQNDLSFDEEGGQISDSEGEHGLPKKGGKAPGRPGRPRGKGRPKRSGKHLSKKLSEDQQEWEEKPYVRERVIPGKDESSIEGYIKIIDYLKKIDYDQVSLQNKMNPYNALTATCFWYAISAEYFGTDFNSRRNSHEIAIDILEKAQKLPLLISTRTLKTQFSSQPIESQPKPIQALAKQLGEKFSTLIPSSMNTRPETIERKLAVSSTAEDDQFISSTKAILFNYISKKTHANEKWSFLLNSFSQQLSSLPEREVNPPEVIEMPKEEEDVPQVSLFELLKQQAKKKIQKRQKNKAEKATKKEDDIFEEQSPKEEVKEEEKPVDKDENAEIKEYNQQNLEKMQIEVDFNNQNKGKNEDECKIQMRIQFNQGQKEQKQHQKEQKQHQKEQKQHQKEQKQHQKEQEYHQKEQEYHQKEEEQQQQQQKQGEQQEILDQKCQKQADKNEMVDENDEQVIKNEIELGVQNRSQSQKDIKINLKRNYTKQDLILNSISHLPLDKVISILQSKLPKIELPETKDQFLPIPTKDPLQFVFQLHPEEEQYLQYMKEHRKKKYREKVSKNEITQDVDEREGQFEDAKCQICTDGDYTDDNLIVFCSMCNISLHQRCVGLAKVPAESWVCDVCLAFGPAGINLPCPLCNVKGGAMKRTSIHIDSNLFRDTNPSFYEYSRKCPYNKQKEEYHSHPKKGLSAVGVDSQGPPKEQIQKIVEEKQDIDAEPKEEREINGSQQNRLIEQQKENRSNKSQIIEGIGQQKAQAEEEKEKVEGIKSQELSERQEQEKQENQKEGSPQEVQVSCKSKPDLKLKEKPEKEQEEYYDYFVKSTYPTDVPTCHYVWVHYVCAIWVPECYFEEKNGIISVKGIENIDNRRFKSQCCACKKSKCGAAVKCEDSECNKYYHPQCARKKKVYMEQLNLEKLKYLIFCQEHEPLKLTRQIEYKKKKNRQEIIKFARMIEKYIETYRIAVFPFKLMKSAVQRNFMDSARKTERDEHAVRKANITSDQNFLKDLINNLKHQNMMTVHLDKVDNGYKINNVVTPSKRQIKKCLNRYDQFWKTLKNGDSAEENFRRYDRIIVENQRLRQKIEKFLNGTVSVKKESKKAVGKRRGRQAQVETLIEEEGGIFCVCKKPYQGESNMFECEVCGEWYHFDCLGFIGSEQDAQKMEFTCMKCMKFENKEHKEERLNKYVGLFSPDSIIYKYRPPTPELMSEQEMEHKNFDAMMSGAKNASSVQADKDKHKENNQNSHKEVSGSILLEAQGVQRDKQNMKEPQQQSPKPDQKEVLIENKIEQIDNKQVEYQQDRQPENNREDKVGQEDEINVENSQYNPEAKNQKSLME